MLLWSKNAWVGWILQSFYPSGVIKFGHVPGGYDFCKFLQSFYPPGVIKFGHVPVECNFCFNYTGYLNSKMFQRNISFVEKPPNTLMPQRGITPPAIADIICRWKPFVVQVPIPHCPVSICIVSQFLRSPQSHIYPIYKHLPQYNTTTYPDFTGLPSFKSIM